MDSADYDRRVLAFNPFDGDFGDGETRLENRMVTARVGHVCHWCLGLVAPGERGRLLKEADRGEIKTYRWCRLCCDGMAEYDTNPDLYEKRAATLRGHF